MMFCVFTSKIQQWFLWDTSIDKWGRLDCVLEIILGVIGQNKKSAERTVGCLQANASHPP